MSHETDKIKNNTNPTNVEWPKTEIPYFKYVPKFLFIFTPPNSGSTALAQILNTGNRSMFLNPKAEGQWLIPELCKTDRWQGKKHVNWFLVKAMWMKKIQSAQNTVGNIEIVIEKSPPNLVRAPELLRVFPNHQIITFNRNPYANCSSILYRHYSPETKSEKERIKILKELAGWWVYRSTYIKEIAEENKAINLTYEEFCKNVTSTLNLLRNSIPELEEMNLTCPPETVPS